MQFATLSAQFRTLHKVVAIALAASIALAPVTPAFAAFGDGTPTITNADLFTSDKTTPKVDSQSGAFSQRIPLDIPPGRNGLQPDLALQYNSQSTADSIVGYGWSLSLPYVQRLNKYGSQNLYNPQLPYFTSSLDGELANVGTSTAAATTSPSILDTLPITLREVASPVTSDSFSYSVPAGGTNKLLVAMIALGADKSASLSVTQNGVPLTCQYLGVGIRTYHHICYLANPLGGVFSMSWSGGSNVQYSIMTLKDAAQSSPIDVYGLNTLTSSGSSLSTSVTTAVGGDLLLDHVVGSIVVTHTIPVAQTQTYMGGSSDPFGKDSQSYKLAAGTPGSESMSRSFSPNDNNDDLLVVAIKKATVGSALVSGSYKARVDDGTSLAYAFANNAWTAYDKKGNRYLFGSDDASRQYDTGTGTSTNTYKWMLREIRDPNNNYVKFSYARDSNEIYPSQILYTGNGSTDGIFKITFATSTRADVRATYAPTFGVTTNYRVSEIDALINGTTVRKYLLGYGSGHNGKRSLLTSVQEQGYDENNTLTSLPAATFTYISSSTAFVWPQIDNRVVTAGYMIGDVNGNGINDVTDFYRPVSTALGDIVPDGRSAIGMTFPTLNPAPDYLASGSTNCGVAPTERGVRFLDMNADGKADLIKGYSDQNNHANDSSYLQLNAYASSTGYAWSGTTTSGTIPAFAIRTPDGTMTLSGGVLGDINGDGLPDYSTWLQGYISAQSYVGNGLGWNTTSSFSPAQSFPVSAPTPTASMLVDVNGDGLDDWIYSDSSNIYVRLNTGTGWNSTDSTQWTIATTTLFKSPDVGTTVYYDRGIRFLDVNGDGLPDFIHSYQMSQPSSNAAPTGEVGNYKVVFLNTGNGWATSTAYTLPQYVANGRTPSGVWSGDICLNEYANWAGNGQQAQDVISTVTNSKGGATSVIYKNSTQSSGKNPELPYSLLVVTDLGVYDGRGNAATTTYTYAGGKQYASLGVRDRKFAGFASSTITAPDSVTSSYFSQGMSTSTPLGEQSDGYAQINRPFRKDIFDLAGNLVQKSFYRWDAAGNGNSTFVGLGRQVQQDYAADATHRDSATDFLYASTTNDLVKKTDFGEVSGNDDGTFTDIGTDKRTTNIAYAASSSPNFTVPTEKSVLDYSGATSSDQKLYYDGLAFGSVTKGNNTREESWIATSTYASSTKTFNIYGLVASSTDRRGKLTTNIFDAYNLNVASSTNPLSQQTQFMYDYSVGKVKQTTDPNSRLSRTLYDGIGRVREIDQSDVTTPSTFATTTTFQYTDAATPPTTIHRADYLTSTSTVDTYQYLDGLGRLIQERKASEYAGIFAAADRTYNPAGKLGSLSLPYFSSGSSFTSASTNSLLFTNYTYDALQRPLAAVNAVGTTTNLYAKWTTTTSDADSNIKDYVRDAFGNLINVVEHPSSSLATTTYAYDAANNLATTTDALGNVRAFSYDGLGRRISAQDLHYATDTTYGTSTYSYDDAGNMTSQTDPKGQVTTRVYDSLNRLLTESFGGLAQITNTYDSCTKGIGYLCTASSTSASSTSVYDALGRVATTTMSVFGIPYSTGNAYDLQGNITTLTYPNNSQVWYTYNAAGVPARVARKAPGSSTYTDFISNIDYGPHGQIVNTLFANGASTTRNFNANAIYRLSTLQTVGASSTYLQNFLYSYDPVGNITQIGNVGSTSAYAVTNFGYDALNRLIVASTSPQSSAQATTTIAIADALPVALHQSSSATSDAFSYTVPAGGTNKLLVAMIALGADKSASLAATQNGSPLTCQKIAGPQTRGYHFYCYLANPPSGTFSVSWSGTTGIQYELYTLQNAAQSSPIDASAVNDLTASGALVSTNVTTTAGSDLLIDNAVGALNVTHSFGTGQNPVFMGDLSNPLGKDSASYRKAATSTGTETMTRNFVTNDNSDDLAVIAVKQLAASSSPAAPPFTPYRQAFVYDALGNILSVTNGSVATISTTPSILDTLPLTMRQNATWVTSDSFAYTVPAGGTNKLFVAYGVLGGDRSSSIAATQNGVSLTCKWIGVGTRAYHFICYLPNPSTGTFQLSWTGAINYEYTVLTLNNAAQSNPIDALNLNTLLSSGSSLTTSTTTSQGNDLLLDNLIGALSTTQTHGANQSQTYTGSTADVFGETSMSAKAAASTPGSESMSWSFSPNDNNDDLALYALKPVATAASSGTTTTYTYAGTGYANPDAVTQTAYGTATTSLAYDQNGNVTQSGIWTYLYDYLNRTTTIGGGGSTSTFGYDTFGSRVFQAGTTSTTTYANKFYSIASTTLSGTSWATTTSYIWLGDTLLGTVDQQFKSGAATGTAKSRYVHPDHLGSTNVVTDENDHLIQTLDYYPFGATRIAVATSTNIKRKWIGQFADDQTSLDYLNARYYDSSRGQFVNEDPVAWEIGQTQDGRAALLNPQAQNFYGYANDNPITNKDPQGRIAGVDDLVELGGVLLFSAARAAFVTGVVTTDFAIASNIAGNVTSGRPTVFDATPSSLLKAGATGAAYGFTADTGAGILAPGLKIFTASARAARLASQGISAAGVTTGADLLSGMNDPSQVISDASFSAITTLGASKAFGITRGSDVKSFSSPLFFNGANMRSTARTEIASQGLQNFATAALRTVVGALQSVVASLQAQRTQSSTSR